MFVREAAHGIGVEQPSLERSRREDELAHDWPEGSTKPSSKGNGKPHFAASQDGPWDHISEGAAKDCLGPPPAQLEASWQRSNVLDELVIEERHTALNRCRH